MVNQDYAKGYKDGWHEAITEMRIRIYRYLNQRSEEYKAQKCLNMVFKWIGELE